MPHLFRGCGAVIDQCDMRLTVPTSTLGGRGERYNGTMGGGQHVWFCKK